MRTHLFSFLVSLFCYISTNAITIDSVVVIRNPFCISACLSSILHLLHPFSTSHFAHIHSHPFIPSFSSCLHHPFPHIFQFFSPLPLRPSIFLIHSVCFSSPSQFSLLPSKLESCRRQLLSPWLPFFVHTLPMKMGIVSSLSPRFVPLFLFSLSIPPTLSLIHASRVLFFLFLPFCSLANRILIAFSVVLNDFL